jgi:ketosteroid isomerase-like protein
MHTSINQMIGVVLLATAVAPLGGRNVGAQQGADVPAVTAANRAFYEAVSARDLTRMDALWAHEPYVRAIHPTSQHVHVGWEAVRASWQDLFTAFPEIAGAMPDPQVRVGDKIAWVTGEERFRGRRNSGEEVSVTLLGTSVFESSGDGWLMVHHHVSVPLRPRQ